MFAYDVMSAYQNVHKQTFPSHFNLKTSLKCIQVVIVMLQNLYSTPTFVACAVDHGAPKHTLHKLLHYVNYKRSVRL